MSGFDPGGGWPSIPGYVNRNPEISTVVSRFSSSIFTTTSSFSLLSRFILFFRRLVVGGESN